MPAAALAADQPAATASQDTAPAASAAQGDAPAPASDSAADPPACARVRETGDQALRGITASQPDSGHAGAQLARALYAVGLRPSRDQVAAIVSALGGALPDCTGEPLSLTRDMWRSAVLRLALGAGGDGERGISGPQSQLLLAYGRERGWGGASPLARNRGAITVDGAGEAADALPPLEQARRRIAAQPARARVPIDAPTTAATVAPPAAV